MKHTTPYFRRLTDCVGKEPFASPQLARKVLRRRLKASRHRRAQVHKERTGHQVYHCAHCSMFHIGTRAKSVHARRQRDHDDGGFEDMA